MRCPACGFVGFDHLPTCRRCGKELPRPPRGRSIVTIAPPPLLSSGQSSEESGPGPGRPDAGEPPAPTNSVALGTLEGPPSVSRVPQEAASHDRAAAPAASTSLPRAGFWLRAAAFMVDLVILAALVAAGGVLVGGAVRIGGWFSSAPEAALEWLEGSARAFLSALIDLGYFTFFVGWRGQTPGKMLLRLRIIRVDGGEVGYARAFVRWIGQILSFLPLGIGFLMIGLSRRRQGLHDRIAGTFVVRLPS